MNNNNSLPYFPVTFELQSNVYWSHILYVCIYLVPPFTCCCYQPEVYEDKELDWTHTKLFLSIMQKCRLYWTMLELTSYHITLLTRIKTLFWKFKPFILTMCNYVSEWEVFSMDLLDLSNKAWFITITERTRVPEQHFWILMSSQWDSLYCNLFLFFTSLIMVAATYGKNKSIGSWNNLLS